LKQASAAAMTELISNPTTTNSHLSKLILDPHHFLISNPTTILHMNPYRRQIRKRR
jgi:hypothetical protein